MKLKTLSLTCLLMTLSACQSIEKNVSVDSALNTLNLQQETWAAQTNTSDFTNNGWLTNLKDPRLEKYVAIALKNNFSLQANQAQLSAQLQNARISAARLFPSVDFTLRQSKTETENTTNNSTNNDIISNTNYDGNVNISWEIDVWQRLTAQKKADAKTVQATAADFEAARLSLVASVARAWFNLNSLKLRIDLANSRLDSIKESLEIVEEQYLNGSQSALNVYLNRADHITQQATIFELNNSLQSAIRDFQILLGEYPNLDISFTAALPTLEEPVPAGLPAELVMRRPDVLADLYEWQSSAYDAKAAQRARYPSFSLTASYGASSNSLSTLDEKTLLFNLINNLSVPLFKGGQLKAQAKAAELLQDASFKLYLATLLRSFNEVETALSTETSLKSRLALTQKASTLSESGYELALEQYTSGISDYQNILESRRRWFDAQTLVINLQNSLLQNRVSLNLALGGDFDTSENALQSTPIIHADSRKTLK